MNKFAIASSLVLAAAACSSGDAVLHERTTTPIGPAGGTARSADGALSIVFAPNTITTDVELVIETLRDVTHPALLALVYEIEPESLALAKPVEMRFEVDATRAAGPTVVRVEGATLLAEDDSTFDDATRVASARVDHFSMWSVASIGAPHDGGAPRDGGPAPDSGTRDGGPAPDSGARDGGPAPDSGTRDGGPAPDGGARDGGAPFPPTILTTALPSTARCTTYLETLQATVSPPPATWSIVSGALPAGIELASDGTLHGATSDPAGPYAFTARVTDGAGATADVALTIDVLAEVDGVRWISMVGYTGSATVSHMWVADVCGGAPSPTRVSPAVGFPDFAPQMPGIPGGARQVAMAPDGRAVAYYGAARAPSAPELALSYAFIHVVDLRGATPGASIALADGVSVPNQTLMFSDDSTKLGGAGDFSTHLADVTDPSSPGAHHALPALLGEGLITWFSPDSDKIAYYETDPEVAFVVRDVSNLASGTIGPAELLVPPSMGFDFWFADPVMQWTRGSNAIVWSDNGVGASNFYWAALGTVAPHPITPLAGIGATDRSDHEFSMSPDGAALFYLANADHTLRLVDLVGPTPGPSSLATDAGYDDVVAARWSADSQSILLSGHGPGGSNLALFVVDVSGGLPATPVRLSPAGLAISSASFSGFAWSPDDRRAAYVAPNAVAGDALYVVDVAPPYTNTLVNTPTPGVEVIEFQFAPDGRRIAGVTRDAGGVHRLHTASIAGATPSAWSLVHPAPISTSDDVTTPPQDEPNHTWFWTADGRGLVFMGAFTTADAEEVWFSDVSGAPPFAPQRISPPGVTATQDILRIWAGGDYARDPYLRR